MLMFIKMNIIMDKNMKRKYLDIHQELILRCEVIQLSAKQMEDMKLLGEFPNIGEDFIPVLCTNISHKNLPIYYCYIHYKELIDYIKFVYLKYRTCSGIINIMQTYNIFNWSDESCILSNPKIDKYFKVQFMDEFIYSFYKLHNKILKKYLKEEQILSLYRHQSFVEFNGDNVFITNMIKEI